jgi:hypothetical protein
VAGVEVAGKTLPLPVGIAGAEAPARLEVGREQAAAAISTNNAQNRKQTFIGFPLSFLIIDDAAAACQSFERPRLISRQGFARSTRYTLVDPNSFEASATWPIGGPSPALVVR